MMVVPGGEPHIQYGLPRSGTGPLQSDRESNTSFERRYPMQARDRSAGIAAAAVTAGCAAGAKGPLPNLIRERLG